MHLNIHIYRFNAVKGVLFLFLLAVLVVGIQPAATEADVTSIAESAGFGAAFGYAQTIGPLSYAQTGSIGNAWAYANANTPATLAITEVWTAGNASAAAHAIGTPFGSMAAVQLISFWDGAAFGYARARP